MEALRHCFEGRARCFPVEGGAVEVLFEPQQFYQALQDGLARSQQSITIASLYIGTEEGRERQFVEALAAAAFDSCRPRLRVQVLLDALRSTRPTHSLAGRPLTSTAELLAQQLLEGQASGSERVRVALFHTPSLRGLLKRMLPARVREVVGVCHTKIYLFDDTVLLSGANISNTYLDNRQDRYLLIRHAPELADFLRSAVDRIAALSYQLQPPGAGSRSSAGSSSTKQQQQQQQLLYAWLQQRQAHLEQQPQAGAFSLGPCPAGVDPTRHAWLFNRQLRQSMLGLFVPPSSWHAVVDAAVLQAEHAEETCRHGSWQRQQQGQGLSPQPSSSLTGEAAAADGASKAPATGGSNSIGAWQSQQRLQQPGSQADTWVVPMVQAGFAGLRQEEYCTLGLLGHAAESPGSLLQVSTPYLNLGRPYEWQLAQVQARPTHLELLTSSPEANGFFGSRGVSGLIPLAYSTLEHRTWMRLTGRAGMSGRLQPWRHRLSSSSQAAHELLERDQGSSSGPGMLGSRTLLEYARPGWEFHSKGIWWTPAGEAAPIVTAVGSSNYGFRSLHRDLEINFMLLTSNDELREQLAEEWRRLAAHAAAVQGSAHFLQPGRRAGLVGRTAVRMLRSFL